MVGHVPVRDPGFYTQHQQNIQRAYWCARVHVCLSVGVGVGVTLASTPSSNRELIGVYGRGGKCLRERERREERERTLGSTSNTKQTYRKPIAVCVRHPEVGVGGLLFSCPPAFLRQGLSLNPEITDWPH